MVLIRKNNLNAHFVVFLLTSFFFIYSSSANAFVDLAVNSSGINFSNDNPIEKENIIINATIANLGNESAADIIVQFLDDSIEIGNITINVSANSIAVASQYWMTEIGPNEITVMVDPENKINESWLKEKKCKGNKVQICHVPFGNPENSKPLCIAPSTVNLHLAHGDYLGPCLINKKNNNEASKKIAVGAYHIYYGTANGYLGLGINFDFLLKIGNLTGSNIFVADTDSNVDFSSLQAVGRRKNEWIGYFDFRDIDVLLGMTSFDDSISKLYTLLGFGMFPKQTELFNLFDYTIQKVPIIKSTNRTAFRTGILWDTSDDSGGLWGQFDVSDQEDLVFVTKINQSQSGAYGLYDYEIKIPALLRDYKPGSPMVDFYIEI